MATEYPKALADIRRRFITHPLTQHKVKVSPAEAAGSAELAYYRGIQEGEHRAFLLIKERFPRVAKFLLKELGMDENGSIGVG